MQRQLDEQLKVINNYAEKINQLTRPENNNNQNVQPIQPSPNEDLPATQQEPSQSRLKTKVKPKPEPEPEPRPQLNQQEQEAKQLADQRREAVKQGILHAWNSYKEHAWGGDELRPISHTQQNWINMGATIVDSVDLLKIVGLEDEFKLARDWIADHLSFDQNYPISTFETTIRVLGGLLSAFDLSGDQMFLDKAETLGEKLLKSFTGAHPFPFGSVNLVTGEVANAGWSGGNHILSEVGSIQLEFLYLARKTNKSHLAEKALNVMKRLDQMPKDDNLYYLYITQDQTWGSGTSSLGGLGDSFYEYLLKLWLLTGKKGEGFRRMYVQAMDPVTRRMITELEDRAFLVELSGGNKGNRMEHLTCFAGGMFSLGAHFQAVSQETAPRHLEIAKKLAQTCFSMYSSTATGLSPESATFDASTGSLWPSAPFYILRPETVESFFVLWRVTHDPIYREWGWKVFEAIEKNCRVPGGYTGLRDVTRPSDASNYDDLQQTFLLAETFKYLYLLFADDDVIPIDKYVFNTEAHPLSVFTDVDDWSPAFTSLFP